MDAAIQEAVKDIPYPVDEDVSFSHDFGYYEYSNNLTPDLIIKEVTIDSDIIASRKAKRMTLNLSLTGERDRFSIPDSADTYVGRVKLPEGGTYIQLHEDGGFDFMAGGETLVEISANSKATGMGDIKISKTFTVYITRLS